MTVFKRYMERVAREARQAAGIPESENALELVEEFLPKAVGMINQIATTCADPKLRLEASKMIVELGEVARRERDKRDEQYYAGDASLLKQLAMLPQGEQRLAALQMFAEQRMNRTDLDAVLRLIDNAAQDRIAALVAENEKLVRTMEGEEPQKVINGSVNGSVHHPVVTTQ